MHLYDLATITAPQEDADALSAAHTDPVTHECPIDWPLENAKIVVNGSSAIVTVPAPPDWTKNGVKVHKRDLRVDRLTDVKITGHDKDGQEIVVTGVSELLTQNVGFDPDDARLTFTVKKYKLCPIN